MIVVEVVFLVLFWAWVATALVFLRNTVLPRLPLSQDPRAFGLPFDTVQFEATDGLRLEGWRMPASPGAPWVILCHGVGSNRSDLLDIAAGLHQAGFNLLLFDFRGHGGSQGRATSFGWEEQRYLEGVLAFLGQQPEVPARPYGVYGISMGGAVALMVASRDERIVAVAADSPYPRLDETLGRHLQLMFPLLPRIPFHWYVLGAYRVRFGVWPRRISPQEAVERLSPRPLLLIHGSDDFRIPLAGAQKLFARAGQPKTLWIAKGAEHLGAFSQDPQRYVSKLECFFQDSLGEPSRRRRGHRGVETY